MTRQLHGAQCRLLTKQVVMKKCHSSVFQGCSITKGKQIVASRDHPCGMATWSSNNRPEPFCSGSSGGFQTVLTQNTETTNTCPGFGGGHSGWGPSLGKHHTENVPESPPRPRQEMHADVVQQSVPPGLCCCMEAFFGAFPSSSHYNGGVSIPQKRPTSMRRSHFN